MYYIALAHNHYDKNHLDGGVTTVSEIGDWENYKIEIE